MEAAIRPLDSRKPFLRVGCACCCFCPPPSSPAATASAVNPQPPTRQDIQQAHEEVCKQREGDKTEPIWTSRRSNCEHDMNFQYRGCLWEFPRAHEPGSPRILLWVPSMCLTVAMGRLCAHERRRSPQNSSKTFAWNPKYLLSGRL